MQEVQLKHQLELTGDCKGIPPARIAASALVQSLAGVERADLELACTKHGGTHYQSSISVNFATLKAMHALQQLKLVLPGKLAASFDRRVLHTSCRGVLLGSVNAAPTAHG